MQKFVKNNWAGLVLIFSVLAFSFWMGGELPEKVATRWDLQGQPTDFTNKGFVIYFIPAMALFVVTLTHFLVRLSPENFNLPRSEQVVGKMNFAVAGLLSIIQVGLLMHSVDRLNYPFEGFLIASFAFFLIVAGNFMSKLERNYFIGVRVSWTLASEQNWRATHRFAARSMMTAGALLLALIYFQPHFLVALAILVTSVLLPVLFSYQYYVKNERKAEH